MAMWNPWRGCKKCGDWCLHCYIHKGDAKRGVNTNDIVKTKDFYKPTEKLKNGNYKMKAGRVRLHNEAAFLFFLQRSHSIIHIDKPELERRCETW